MSGDELPAFIGGICGLAILWGLASAIISGIKTRTRYRRWGRLKPTVDSVIAQLSEDGRRLPISAANILIMASNMCRDGEVDFLLEAIEKMEKTARNANNGRLPLSLQYAY